MTHRSPPSSTSSGLSDDTGLLEHARGAIPRRECGYCLDDAARGLVVASRHPSPPAAVEAERYLAFVSHAQVGSGRCHNRLGYDRRWEDEAGLGGRGTGGRHDRP